MRRDRATLWLILAVCLAPVLASYGLYYLARPAAQTNYGELLLPPAAVPDEPAGTVDGRPYALAEARGRWALLVVAPAACAAPCARALYATRQARTMQGKEQERVQRLWLATGAATAPPGLLATHPDLVVIRGPDAPPPWVALAPGASTGILVVDPLGNLMMRFPADPDIRRLARDLTRLLKASRIG